MLKQSVAGILAVAILISGHGAAAADDYPSKPIRIVTAQPGGNTDFTARVIAQALNQSVGQPVIVLNRPSGIVAAETLLNAAPDGYSLLLQASSFWIGPLLQKLPYDPVKDFAPISMANTAPFFLYVHPSIPANNVKELIALAKSRPGRLHYGSSAAGSSNHLAAALFVSMAGIDVVRVPYKGAGQAGIGLVANEVQMMFGSAPFGLPLVKQGRLKMLAAGSTEPSAFAPGVPTVSASGLPGYEAESISGIWVLAQTPKAIVKRLNDEVVRILARPDVRNRFERVGMKAVGTSPEKFASIIKADMERWSRVIKQTGIRVAR